MLRINVVLDRGAHILRRVVKNKIKFRIPQDGKLSMRIKYLIKKMINKSLFV